MVKVIYQTIRNCSEKKEFAPSGSKFFPLREVPILKSEVIEENHCLIQLSTFDKLSGVAIVNLKSGFNPSPAERRFILF